MPRSRSQRITAVWLAWCLAASLLSSPLTHVLALGEAEDGVKLSDEHLLHLLRPTSRAGLPGWQERQEELAAEVQAARDNGGLDVAVYGDSIMEAWRAQSVGMDASDRYSANKDAWDRLMKPKHKAAAFAIAGDQTVHLLWRLQNGEGPQGLNPKVVTVMIGTNDVAHLGAQLDGDHQMVGHIIRLAVQECVAEVQRQAPKATVVVFGLLPLIPRFLGVPQFVYQDSVKAANAEIQQYVEGQASQQLRFKDCGGGFLLANGTLDYSLMPDGIHPAAGGAEVLLNCMLEAIDGALS